MRTRTMKTIAGVMMALSLAACAGGADDDEAPAGGAESGLVKGSGSSGSGKVCPPVLLGCPSGSLPPLDTDGDGCVDACGPVEPPACPPVLIGCHEGTRGVDSDGDGCIDSCAPAR